MGVHKGRKRDDESAEYEPLSPVARVREADICCFSVRSLTEARGYDTSRHILSSFGGAGGQHACAIASTLGITTILVHRYSSILSAYGMALAERCVLTASPPLQLGF